MIQTGLYARKKISVQRLAGLCASQGDSEGDECLACIDLAGLALAAPPPVAPPRMRAAEE